MPLQSPSREEEKGELLAILMGFGGGIAVGLACTILAVYILWLVGIEGPPNAGMAVIIGYLSGVFTGRRLLRRRRPPAP